MGFNLDRFLCVVPADLICSVCKNVLEDPSKCELDVAFCGPCGQKPDVNGKSCCDFHTFPLSEPLAVDEDIQQQLNQLQLTCSFTKYGCDKSGLLEKLAGHELNCPFNPDRGLVAKSNATNCDELDRVYNELESARVEIKEMHSLLNQTKQDATDLMNKLRSDSKLKTEESREKDELRARQDEEHVGLVLDLEVKLREAKEAINELKEAKLRHSDKQGMMELELRVALARIRHVEQMEGNKRIKLENSPPDTSATIRNQVRGAVKLKVDKIRELNSELDLRNGELKEMVSNLVETRLKYNRLRQKMNQVSNSRKVETRSKKSVSSSTIAMWKKKVTTLWKQLRVDRKDHEDEIEKIRKEDGQRQAVFRAENKRLVIEMPRVLLNTELIDNHVFSVMVHEVELHEFGHYKTNQKYHDMAVKAAQLINAALRHIPPGIKAKPLHLLLLLDNLYFATFMANELAPKFATSVDGGKVVTVRPVGQKCVPEITQHLIAIGYLVLVDIALEMLLEKVHCDTDSLPFDWIFTEKDLDNGSVSAIKIRSPAASVINLSL